MSADNRKTVALMGVGLLALLWYSTAKAAMPTPTTPAAPPAPPRDEAAYKAGFLDGGADAALSMNKAAQSLGVAVVAETPKLVADMKGADKGQGYQDGFVLSVKNYAPAGFEIEGTSDDLFGGKAKVIRKKVTTYESGRYDGENDAVDSLASFDPETGAPARIERFRADMAGTAAEKGYKDGYMAVLADNKPPFVLYGELLSGKGVIRLPESA